MYLNKAYIIGNLTRDPELKSLPSGVEVATFGVATNRVFKDKEGKNNEDTQYHNIVVFGRQAGNVAQYLRKGSSVLIEGRIQNRTWDAPDGTKRYRSEIVAERVQFGPRRVAAEAEGGTRSENVGKGNKSTPQAAPELATIDYPDEDINPEDIPF